MTKITYTTVALFALVATLGAMHTTHAAITTSLSLGSRGNQVTELQQFLATNPMIYPQGIVTGYFGALTQAAVIQFQTQYDIPQVGRVGPMTQAKINSIMSSGNGLDISAPGTGNMTVQTNRNGATVSWSTGEAARSQVYYDASPIRADEAPSMTQLSYIGGVQASSTSDLRTTHSVILQNLQPNTLYYYITRSIDNSGNATMTWPQTFRTDQ